MEKASRHTDFWHQLTPVQLQQKFVPKNIATAKQSVFYTNCDSKAINLANTSCEIFGLTTNESKSYLATLYLGWWEINDIYEIYEDLIESGTFNFLDEISGSIEMKKPLSMKMIPLLEAYAQQMPDTNLPYTFEALNQAEIDHYRIRLFPNTFHEIFRFKLQLEDFNKDQDNVILIKFSTQAKTSFLISIDIAEFSQKEFQENLKFNVFRHGKGAITLTRAALLELTAMLKARVANLVEL